MLLAYHDRSDGGAFAAPVSYTHLDVYKRQGLWWLSLPMLAAALWFYFNDGRMKKAGKIKA